MAGEAATTDWEVVGVQPVGVKWPGVQANGHQHKEGEGLDIT